MLQLASSVIQAIFTFDKDKPRSGTRKWRTHGFNIKSNCSIEISNLRLIVTFSTIYLHDRTVDVTLARMLHTAVPKNVTSSESTSSRRILTTMIRKYYSSAILYVYALGFCVEYSGINRILWTVDNARMFLLVQLLRRAVPIITVVQTNGSSLLSVWVSIV